MSFAKLIILFKKLKKYLIGKNPAYAGKIKLSLCVFKRKIRACLVPEYVDLFSD